MLCGLCVSVTRVYIGVVRVIYINIPRVYTGVVRAEGIYASCMQASGYIYEVI